MTRRTVGWVVWAASMALAVAWIVEASTVGRGFISIYLAPFAIVGNFVAMRLMRKPSLARADSKLPR